MYYLFFFLNLVCVKTFTRVGYNEVSSLVVEGSVSSTGRVPCSGQALVAKVHGVAVIQQRLSYLRLKRQQTE